MNTLIGYKFGLFFSWHRRFILSQIPWNQYRNTPRRKREIIHNIEQEILKDQNKLQKTISEKAKTILKGRVHNTFYNHYVNERRKQGDEIFVCIGPGGKFHPAWTTVDKKYNGKDWSLDRRGVKAIASIMDIEWDAYSMTPLPFADHSVSLIYCSHVIEHLHNTVSTFFFQECFRILKKRGKMRVTTPNADLYFKAYDLKDASFFLEHSIVYNESLISTILKNEDKNLIDQFMAWSLLGHFSLVTNEHNTVYFTPEDCITFINKHGGAQLAVNRACELSSLEINQKLGNHVDWWNWKKLSSKLKENGFNEVELSSYLQSNDPLMRHQVYFDRTDPHNTLFIEAIR